MRNRAGLCFWVSVLGLVAVQIAQVVWLWADGYDAVSSDELFRSYQAYRWSRDPSFFPPFFWPPFYYWVYGSAVAVFPDPLWTSRIVTLALAAANTILVARFLLRLSRDRRGTLIVVAAWALSPLFLRLASVALAETLTTTCLIIALDRFFAWDESKSRWALMGAALALAAAALTRFETWLYVAAFGVYLALRRADWRERVTRIAIAAIPAAAALSLVIHSVVTTGHPFFAVTVFAADSAAQRLDAFSTGAKIGENLVAGAPLVLLSALLGLVFLGRDPSSSRSKARAVAALALVLPVILSATSQLQNRFPSRIVALPLVLLLPAAVLQLSSVLGTARGRFTAAVGLTLILVVGAFFQAREAPSPFPYAIRAGKELRAMAAAKTIGRSDVVFAEANDWDGIGLWAFSNLKERIQFDTEAASPKPSLFFHPRPEKLGAELFRSGVRWVLVRAPFFAERARRAFEVAESRAIAGYELMRVTGPKRTTVDAPP